MELPGPSSTWATPAVSYPVLRRSYQARQHKCFKVPSRNPSRIKSFFGPKYFLYAQKDNKKWLRREKREAVSYGNGKGREVCEKSSSCTVSTLGVHTGRCGAVDRNRRPKEALAYAIK